MTATVISSASVIFGTMPTFGRHRFSSGLAFNSSSIFTYSAVARVSRSVCTSASVSMLLSNTDHGHPSISTVRDTPDAISLGIDRLAETRHALAAVFREEAGRLTASVMRVLGDFDAAEEVV